MDNAFSDLNRPLLRTLREDLEADVAAIEDNNADALLSLIPRLSKLTGADLEHFRLIVRDRFPKLGVSGFSRAIKAAQPRHQQHRASWYDMLPVVGQKGPIACLANAQAALRMAPEWKDVLAYDSFHHCVSITGALPWGETPEKWTDHEDRLVTEWLQLHGILVKTDIAGQAVQTIAMEREMHPVREYLQRLEWDGTPRLHNWLPTYVGCQDTEVHRASGWFWLLSGVARIMKPGSKVDTMLVLEGRQGAGKSTVFRILGQPWYTDHIDDLGNKDAQLQLSGVWVMEFGELDVLTRTRGGQSTVKAFLTRQTERYRPPYGKRVVEVPRQCIFGGSTNSEAWNTDETGARRYYPVWCGGTIDLAALERDRDQLWAEAVLEHNSGHQWWVEDGELAAKMRDHQATRYAGDPWEDRVADESERRYSLDGYVTTALLLTALDRPLKDQGRQEALRVGAIMRARNWRQVFRRIQGKLTRVWVPERDMVQGDLGEE